MKEYTIKVVATSNPTILKFETNHFITKHKNYEFKNIDEASKSPLAKQLFHLPFIKTVYISGNFIGLERFDIVEWNDVKDEVAEQLVAYLNSGEPVVIEKEEKTQIGVTVYAEVTPYPATMKFVASRKIVPATFEFKNIEEAKNSELATALFQFPFVKQVFIDQNFVSVSKYDVTEWDDITMEVRELIRNFIADGKEVVNTAKIAPSSSNTETNTSANVPTNTAEAEAKNYDNTSLQIIDILEEYVKPAVALDGGNILFESYDEESKIVSVILQGACSGCPSSTFTLKNGIESILKNMMGEAVSEVVALNG